MSSKISLRIKISMILMSISTLWSFACSLQLFGRIRKSLPTMYHVLSELDDLFVDPLFAIYYNLYEICLPISLARLLFKRHADLLLRAFNLFFLELHVYYWISQYYAIVDEKELYMYLADQLEQHGYQNVRRLGVIRMSGIGLQVFDLRAFLVSIKSGLEFKVAGLGASGQFAIKKKASTSKGARKARHRLRKGY